MKYFCITLILMFSTNCFAGDQVALFTDPKTCSVREVGYVMKKDPLVINGTVWVINESYAGCTVKIPKPFFEKSYSRCYLTGVQMTNGGSCNFGLKTDGTTESYTFEFNVRPSVSCTFTCDEL